MNMSGDKEWAGEEFCLILLLITSVNMLTLKNIFKYKYNGDLRIEDTGEGFLKLKLSLLQNI